MTVDRQMKRYKVPRLAFINKMDRTGADPFDVMQQMRDKLNANAVMFQYPIGAGETFEGCVDLITQKAYYHEGAKGEKVIEKDMPEELKDQVAEKRQEMLEALSMFSDEMMELLLNEQEVPSDLIYKVAKGAIQSQSLSLIHI